MAQSTLRLRAADDVRVPFRTADGALVSDRYVGRTRVTKHATVDGKPANVVTYDAMPGGEDVAVSSFNRADLMRDVANGHLEIVKSPVVEVPAADPVVTIEEPAATKAQE